MDLKQYIKEELFDPETGRQEIWLHNLPNDETLFDIINKIRETYTIETLVFTEEIRIIDKTINYIDLSYCTFKDRIHIENCIFKEYISFEGSILEKNIFSPAIQDSLFKNIKISGLTINFQGAIFNNLKFENIEFLQIPNIQGQCTNFNSSSLCDVTFEDVKFHIPTTFEFSQLENVSFKKCTFKGNTDFRDVSFKEKSEFLNCTFHSSENNTTEKINFLSSIFEQEANLSGSIFNLKADFSETIFGIKKEDNNSDESSSEVKFLIENAKFQKEVDFSKAIFYDAIYFSGTEFCTDIEDYAKESINFENAQFKRKVRFHHCKFHNTVRFENTSFNKLVDFYYAHFYKPQQFHFTDFLDRAIFSNTEFDEEVQFLHCRVDSNSYIRFESATFKKSLDISRSNFNDKANFWNIELEEGDAFTSSKYQNDFDEKAKTESTKNTPTIYKKIRETYRIIKSNFYSQNNKIEGLKFYEKEMSVYLEEKRAEDKKLNRTNKITLRNLNLENKVDSFFTNKSAIIKKKLTSFCSFFICFYQNILLPSYELLPFIEIFKSILSQFKETFKEVFSFLYKPFYIILYIIVISFKEFRNRNITLYRSSFCIMILFFFLVYMIKKEYCWFWAFVIISTLVVLTEFYDRRRNTRKLIRSNNYIPFVLITFALIWSFIVFYGYGNYKQDFFYLLINKTYYSLKIIIKDIDMLVIGSYGIIILSFIFLVVFRRQDKIILWLNKNSNEFETNWVVGVNFSMLVGCLTYFTILLSINSNIVFDESPEGISNFLTSLVDVFNITKWDNLEIIGVKLKGFSYLLLFIGRIFIGYGYYQTIQAFRKFGKS